MLPQRVIPGVDKGADALKLGTKIFFELAKTGPGAASAEGWWTVRESGTGIAGEASVPGYSSFNGQITRSVADGAGVGHDDLAKSIAGLDSRLRGDLTVDDLVNRDGTLRDWEDIPADKRRAASSAYLDTLPGDDREALSKYIEVLTGERNWGK
jgi:hypothetical protein